MFQLSDFGHFRVIKLSISEIFYPFKRPGGFQEWSYADSSSKKIQ